MTKASVQASRQSSSDLETASATTRASIEETADGAVAVGRSDRGARHAVSGASASDSSFPPIYRRPWLWHMGAGRPHTLIPNTARLGGVLPPSRGRAPTVAGASFPTRC